jgi:hypothetical protein
MMFLAVILVSTIVPMIAALVLDRFWPAAPGLRLELLASLPIPILFAAMMVAVLVSESRHVLRPDEIDRGMVGASIIAAGPLLVLASFVLGFPAASLMLRLRRRGHDA